jgi:hypothetical protein
VLHELPYPGVPARTTVMKDLAGLVILGACVLLPVGVARAALGLIVASLCGSKRTAPKQSVK